MSPHVHGDGECRFCDGKGVLTVPGADGESASTQACPDPVHDQAEGPAGELRRAAALMNQRADAMEAEMKANGYWHWPSGAGIDQRYQCGVRGALGGTAGQMASRWDLKTVREVASWLGIEAAALERKLPDDSGRVHVALRIARAYLSEGGPS